ncbi:hypothetical protein BOTNAR_0418g00110 [Botryotinia narcissicola]|uniref:Acyl-CoA thioesterase-like C-terminal domain-containing protein n=1 Tax=Botryotinia narcissicola TaxID=278944 RepID=A0A4Z1HYB9_9HELO|nr:hypothetical protein BOTNAR_0418g00110 [Botryotinia narcissicola]
MAQDTMETPPSLPDVLAQNIKFIKKGEHELDLPSSSSFSPHPAPLTPSSMHPRPHQQHLSALDLLPNPLPPLLLPTGALLSQILRPPLPQPPSVRDQWLTPTHPSTRFINEILSFLLDISFPILDNFYPEKASRGQAATVQAGLAQKREREMGVTNNVDVESGSYQAPAMITSLATSIEIKRLLAPGGTKWLLMRAQAKEIKDGRLSMEVMVFDEGMELVALSQQLCPIIELSRAMANKQKL